MSSRKRKKYTKDIQCVFFPDDVGTGVQKVGREPPSLSSVCSAKSWEKCGDSFVDTPVIKNLKSSGRKLSAVRKLAQTPALVQTSANEDPVHIAWSSSDSEQSDNETQEQHLSRSVQPQQQRPHRQGRSTAPVRSYTRELHTHSADKDDLPIIDTDSDLDQSEEDVEKDSGQQISDCESESFGEKPKDLNPLKPTNATELEISGYVSDGENIGDIMTPSRPDSESFPLQTGEGSRRSVSDWVRSAQAMLQTPQKAPDRQPKTPEDSAKKKRKFQSGGLAERLNRLQCRQRSAISFWRHQSISDTSTATTVDRPGVLALEVLEVQEECSMQLARCEHHQPPGEGHQHIDPASGERARARVLVLFNRDTAAQLIPAPRDIIHIYPPWLCVLVQDSYGMFSVVQLHLLPRKDDLVQYCQKWQGKTCVLRDIKVVRRVTRERHTRLFSSIDSLWPPAMPLRDHGNTQSTSNESRAAGPAPSFCYLLSGQESSVEPSEGQTVSTLYVPPTGRTLRDILQSEIKTCRCSFVATVIYKRMQSSDVGQGEVWLVLTDPSLQEEQPERPCRRTVALCVSTSCVLTSSVLEALHSPAACCVLFRDAIKEHGVLLCAEQSVVEVQSTTRPESLSQSLTEPQAKTLPQPVILDPLSLETTPNSLCTLTGVIVGVDENTAYSWPACSHCGSDNLEMLAERPQNFHCASCKSAVDTPDTKIQLEVFLNSSSLNNCTLKIKLQKKTIMSVLNVASLEFNEFPGYDVENVLGKEVGPLAVYVRVVTRKPALWISLEEICL
ncbi:DNA repair-scaffolding protein isoform X5 [Lates japonicus]|uniref:DNA repair-scaffolding protein isoform X5 n=1 Tax=Lates japonicus TaxID=270547 RepID=A0AAD3R0Y5_LATJO|nr:DNA repair-scaffolding protein isoform X5 [Lates japonicus]